MNKKQRQRIEKSITELQEIADEEREKVDNAPEGQEDTERYQEMEEAADGIDDALSTLEGKIKNDLD